MRNRISSLLLLRRAAANQRFFRNPFATIRPPILAEQANRQRLASYLDTHYSQIHSQLTKLNSEFNTKFDMTYNQEALVQVVRENHLNQLLVELASSIDPEDMSQLSTEFEGYDITPEEKEELLNQCVQEIKKVIQKNEMLKDLLKSEAPIEQPLVLVTPENKGDFIRCVDAIENIVNKFDVLISKSPPVVGQLIKNYNNFAELPRSVFYSAILQIFYQTYRDKDGVRYFKKEDYERVKNSKFIFGVVALLSLLLFLSLYEIWKLKAFENKKRLIEAQAKTLQERADFSNSLRKQYRMSAENKLINSFYTNKLGTNQDSQLRQLQDSYRECTSLCDAEEENLKKLLADLQNTIKSALTEIKQGINGGREFNFKVVAELQDKIRVQRDEVKFLLGKLIDRHKECLWGFKERYKLTQEPEVQEFLESYNSYIENTHGYYDKLSRKNKELASLIDLELSIRKTVERMDLNADIQELGGKSKELIDALKDVKDYGYRHSSHKKDKEGATHEEKDDKRGGVVKELIEELRSFGHGPE